MMTNRFFGVLWLVWSLLVGSFLATFIWIGYKNDQLLGIDHKSVLLLLMLALIGYVLKWKKARVYVKIALAILSYELLTVLISPGCYSELRELFMLGTMWVAGLVIGIIFALVTNTERPYLMSASGILFAYLLCPITLYISDILYFLNYSTTILICPRW